MQYIIFSVYIYVYIQTYYIHITVSAPVDGTDYDGVSQQITFTGVSKVHTVFVPILNDNIKEETEFFQFVAEKDPSTKLDIRISDVQGLLMIKDDESM